MTAPTPRNLLGLVTIFGFSASASAATLSWTSSGYTAGNVNGAVPSTDPALTSSTVIFQVTNNPSAVGNFINGSPSVSTVDFSAGGLLIDHFYNGTATPADSVFDPDLHIQDVSFVIGDLDSDGSGLKQDGVIVSARNAAGATVFPTISLVGSQVNVTGNPGEAVSNIGPNTGVDDASTQATFSFGSEWIDAIFITYRNYGTAVDDDNHWGIGDIEWIGEMDPVPEPSSSALVLIAALATLRRRRR